MIPKIIHYCWFGGAKKSEFIIDCIASWKVHLKEYKIIEWNENNFDLETNIFVKEAYANKKWAFVSDYVRAHALYNFGGIYLDTDVEVKQSFDVFLSHGAFSGFEEKGFPFTAVWGAEKNHTWPKMVLDYYNSKNGFEQITNTKIVTSLLIDSYGVDSQSDSLQLLKERICIYPSHFFCLKLEQNFAIHHFSGSWIDETDVNYSDKLLKKYYKNKFLQSNDSAQILENLYSDKLITVKDLLHFIFKKGINKVLTWKI